MLICCRVILVRLVSSTRRDSSDFHMICVKVIWISYQLKVTPSRKMEKKTKSQIDLERQTSSQFLMQYLLNIDGCMWVATGKWIFITVALHLSSTTTRSLSFSINKCFNYTLFLAHTMNCNVYLSCSQHNQGQIVHEMLFFQQHWINMLCLCTHSISW